MSIRGLQTGASGLIAAQKALEVTAHNLANVGTDGYTRQRVNQVNRPPDAGLAGGVQRLAPGNGVVVTGIERLADELASRAVRDTLATLGAEDASAGVLERLEGLLGGIDDGANRALSEMWAAWDALVLNPADAAARRGVLDASERFATVIRRAASDLRRTATEVATELADHTAEVNRLTAEVARLNTALGAQAGTGGFDGDIRDAVDRATARLAELVGATTRWADDGTAVVSIGSMPVVQGGRSSTLTLSGDPPVLTTADGGLVVRPAGRVGGLIATASVTLPELSAGLDGLAVAVRDAVNGLHASAAGRPTFDADGNPGGALFAGDGAATLRVVDGLVPSRVAAALTPNPADGNNALAISGLRTAPGPDGSTLGDRLRSLVADLGGRTAAARARRDAARGAAEVARDRRDRAAAVSVDEELTAMIRYQRAYQAAARVITAADEALDVLINRTGLVGR